MLASRTGRVTGSLASIALLNRLLVRTFDRVVVTSEYARSELAGVAASAGCPVDQVPLGVDLATFQPMSGAEPRDRDVLRLVHAGRLSREKSPALAVATAVELHRRGVAVRLDVFGSGPHRHELEELAGDAPVVFRGHVADRRELGGHLAGADVALSVSPHETFGLAVLEALAAGTPVVTADRGGARELVDASCGGWGHGPEAMAEAVLRLAERPRDETRAAARRRAEQFPWSTTVRRMLAIHRRGADRPWVKVG